MKSVILKVIPGIFVLIALGLLLLDIMERPRILIVYSYKPDSPWVREEDVAITETFSKSHLRPNIRKHFLGMDRSWPDRSLSIMKKDVERTISDFKPSILITMDDEARVHIAKDYINRDDITVIFGGVDESPYWHPFFESPNVTGILEELPLKAISELFTTLNKSNLNLHILGDSSLSARAEAKQILNYDWGSHKLVSSWQVNDFEEWKKITNDISNQTDVILITGYRLLRRSRTSIEIVPGQEVIQWMEANFNGLMLSNDVDFVVDGGAITLATSPKEHGREVALLAIKIIAGMKPKELTIEKGHEFYVHLSKSRVASKNLTLPSIYFSAAQAANTIIP